MTKRETPNWQAEIHPASAKEQTETDIQQRIRSQVSSAIEKLIASVLKASRLQALRGDIDQIVESLCYFHADDQNQLEEFVVEILTVRLGIRTRYELEALIPPRILYDHFMYSLQVILKDRKRFDGSSDLHIPQELRDEYNWLLEKQKLLQSHVPHGKLELSVDQMAAYERLDEVKEHLRQLYRELEEIRRRRLK